MVKTVQEYFNTKHHEDSIYIKDIPDFKSFTNRKSVNDLSIDSGTNIAKDL